MYFDFSSDIECYIGRHEIDDSTKAMLFEKHWIPPSNYNFPFCVVTKKGKQTKKYAQRSHLDKFYWLVLSHKDQGLYCKYCALFSVGSGGGVQTNTTLKRLVKEPIKAFDDLLGQKGVLLTHERNHYHQRAVESGNNFLLTFHKPELDVANQNILLRGHRDDGNDGIASLKNTESDSDSLVAKHEGNFKALLKFRIESGDTALRQHLETANANATYISKTALHWLIVEDLCHKFNIDLTWCVGIGTDSCSVMASDTKGAVYELSKKATHAKRCPCSNHVLNNSLAISSKVSSCRNTLATMKKVVAFANASAKRHKVFSEELEDTAMQGICETLKICNALENISSWEYSKTTSDARCLLKAISSPEFIISSICLNDILGTTVSLSRFLQTSSIDLKRAMDAMNDTVSILKQKRIQVNSIFQQLFSEAKEVAKQLGVELKLPRIVSRQTHRQNNMPDQSAEEYFRRAVYIPLTSYTEEDILAVKEAVKTYSQLLNNSAVTTVVAEFQLWVTKWKREAENGTTIPDSLPPIIDNCDSDLYPNMRIFLQILATLPVSVATAERSFSSLRRLKTWLRANMGEERLTGLTLLNIHKDIVVDIDEVITRFGKTKSRKLEFNVLQEISENVLQEISENVLPEISEHVLQETPICSDVVVERPAMREEISSNSNEEVAMMNQHPAKILVMRKNIPTVAFHQQALINKMKTNLK
ncbi:hypothetical protein NQ314_001594 [Rhamnusium bicolor]|uniref:HAT C-terminal dimerisation domain-containing protein n=1 Tax=Rhamnusium bicolor TaxID=1586634 RepID=A0AAV8ZTR7_9CUCU|nr:hypothetical protein NQ314_001594 [Rhamnusium bicolor]